MHKQSPNLSAADPKERAAFIEKVRATRKSIEAKDPVTKICTTQEAADILTQAIYPELKGIKVKSDSFFYLTPDTIILSSNVQAAIGWIIKPMILEHRKALSTLLKNIQQKTQISLTPKADKIFNLSTLSFPPEPGNQYIFVFYTGHNMSKYLGEKTEGHMIELKAQNPLRADQRCYVKLIGIHDTVKDTNRIQATLLHEIMHAFGFGHIYPLWGSYDGNCLVEYIENKSSYFKILKKYKCTMGQDMSHWGTPVPAGTPTSVMYCTNHIKSTTKDYEISPSDMLALKQRFDEITDNKKPTDSPSINHREELCTALPPHIINTGAPLLSGGTPVHSQTNMPANTYPNAWPGFGVVGFFALWAGSKLGLCPAPTQPLNLQFTDPKQKYEYDQNLRKTSALRALERLGNPASFEKALSPLYGIVYTQADSETKSSLENFITDVLLGDVKSHIGQQFNLITSTISCTHERAKRLELLRNEHENIRLLS